MPAGWRDSQTDWQAQRLNDPLIAFETSKHAGAMGREFSLLNIEQSANSRSGAEEGGIE